MARRRARADHPRRRRLTGNTDTTAPHLALVGPTASGKSALAAAVAVALGDVEIVSLDSMQVYRTLDVGTAKPDTATRSAVVHHLLDVADPDEEWSVARTQALARAAVAEIAARGHRALLVGGTGLYVQAVLDDLRLPGEDLERRASLEAETAEPGGVARAYDRLRAADPVAASRIDPHNARRIVRALEVIEVTGQPFSSFGPGVAAFGPTVFPVLVAGVWLPRAVLATRIADRVEAMRDADLVGEVRAAADGPGLSRTARQAIGYREVADALDAGR
ncbi:MAG TPA: tRNA (adenosine(37)-N6)-dimethylallyltransferase MiaA, partial [Acidimicrobiia bacterium]|nr:tRNA (adenosine(37)-N6)-dimethylallyltransferase MiaA [Acidimicrobiia bacterium]